MIQGEWNIVKMGNPSHFGTCKRVRFKNILIETTDLVTNNIESVTIASALIFDTELFEYFHFLKIFMAKMAL